MLCSPLAADDVILRADAFGRTEESAFAATFGPDHPHVAASLEECALLLRKTDRVSEAEELEARAKAIRARQPATS